MEQAGTLGLRFAHAARNSHRAHSQRGEAFVGKTHRFQAAQRVRVIGQAFPPDHALLKDDFLDMAQEPRVVMRDRLHFLHREAFAESLCDVEDAVGRSAAERGNDNLAANTFQFRHAVEPVEIGFQPAQGLLHRFLEIAPDGHDLADRLHRGGQQIIRAFELLKREARDLGDDVIQRRFKTGGRCAGDFVGDLIQRVAHCQLCRDARDGEAGGLGGKRG